MIAVLIGLTYVFQALGILAALVVAWLLLPRLTEEGPMADQDPTKPYTGPIPTQRPGGDS